LNGTISFTRKLKGKPFLFGENEEKEKNINGRLVKDKSV
jgi:hypothetical protein